MQNDLFENVENDEYIYEKSNKPGYSDWFKKNVDSKIWWIEEINIRGRHLFSFDKQKIYNLFEDYPHNMKDEEVYIFDKEEHHWSEFFKSRK